MNKLTWVDWTLLAVGFYFLACFPLALWEDQDADQYRAVVNSFGVHHVTARVRQ